MCCPFVWGCERYRLWNLSPLQPSCPPPGSSESSHFTVVPFAPGRLSAASLSSQREKGRGLRPGKPPAAAPGHPPEAAVRPRGRGLLPFPARPARLFREVGGLHFHDRREVWPALGHSAKVGTVSCLWEQLVCRGCCACWGKPEGQIKALEGRLSSS